MLKKSMVLGFLVTLFTFALLGTAFAENNDPSLLGYDEFKFNAPETKADIAAQSYDYDQAQLAAVGTEAGAWKFTFNAPVTKAEIAARNHDYGNQGLAAVSTEAGDWEYTIASTKTKTGEAIVNEALPVCNEC